MISAKNLILDLLSAAPFDEVPVEGLVKAASVFGSSENSLRVALSRLSSRGLTETAGRGQHRLSASARVVRDQVFAWRTRARAVRRWDGSWWAVFLPLSGRARRERKPLELLGYRALDAGLWIRPANLSGPNPRTRLLALGLDPNATHCSMTQLSVDERARTLWDECAIHRGHKRCLEKLRTTRKSLRRLSQVERARETFLVGGETLHRLATDPLLPPELVDPGPREALTEEMVVFDELGREIWSGLLGISSFERTVNLLEAHA